MREGQAGFGALREVLGREGGWVPTGSPSSPRQEFMSEVRKKIYEARSGVLAERRAQEAAAEHRELMAWNREENRRLQELRCGGAKGWVGWAQPRAASPSASWPFQDS